MASLTLDEVRDFLAANIRAAQRFSEEQQKVLTKLENNEDKEWLESAQQSLKKGETFHATQVTACRSTLARLFTIPEPLT